MPSFFESFAPMHMGGITVHCSDLYVCHSLGCLSELANFILIRLGEYQKHRHCPQSNLVDSTNLEVVVTHGPRNIAWTFLRQLDQHFHRLAVDLYSTKD